MLQLGTKDRRADTESRVLPFPTPNSRPDKYSSRREKRRQASLERQAYERDFDILMIAALATPTAVYLAHGLYKMIIG